ncbi:MAG: MASE1 domain-containing protein [Byssovorax sp.]
MGGTGSQPGRVETAGRLLAVAVVYFGLGALDGQPSPANAWSPLARAPAGVALAALLIGGYGLWPAVAVGALLTSLWQGAPPLVACAIAAASTLEALFGAFALRRVRGFRSTLDRFKDIVGLAVLAAAVAPALGATLAVTALAIAGAVTPGALGRAWITWWIGSVFGAVLVAPALLTWTAEPPRKVAPARLVEAAALGVGLVALATLVFTRPADAATGYPLLRPYLLFLPLIWAALRFGVRGTATGMLIVAVAAVWGTSTGHGQFVHEGRTNSLTAAHLYLSVMSLAMLMLGAVATEWERSRRLLDKSESMLRSVLDGTNDAVYAKDRSGRYVLMNAPGAGLFGLPAEAITGKDDAALFPPEEARALVLHDQLVMNSGEAQDSDETLTIGGQTRMYHTTKAPFRDSQGGLLGIIGISRDVTARRRTERELSELRERRRVEKELRDLDEQARLAVEAAHLGTWFWDLKGGELVCSIPSKVLHGIPADEDLTYPRFLASIHPDDRAVVARRLQRSIDEHASYREEHRAVWPDGSVHWIAGFGSVFYDEAGAPERMLGVFMDITAQKRADIEHAELLLRERAARAEAQAAANAKDEFLAVLSHELRTPLQSMLGWTQVLRGKRVDHHTAEKGLATIERNVKTQAQLIEDLLDISRIVAGTLRVDRLPMRLGPVVEAALATAIGAATVKSIGVDVVIDPLVGEVLGDRDRLEQVVSNLVGNAVKFTPRGGTITVRVERDGEAATITVADSGRGISPEFLPHVFERFRQAESTTRRSHGGLGIGLSIVRHLVELHGGTVTAHSRGESQGAEFVVTLPLARATPPSAALRARIARPTPTSTDTALVGARVLVVDDDPDTCELLNLVLRDAGAEVKAVGSARDAWSEIASFQPDLLVSDISMPGDDGYALIRQVRARESVEGGHVPAVALTAFASRADRELSLSLGFEEHIAKPVSPADLTRTAARLLRRST